MTLDCASQMTSTIVSIRSFLHQKILSLARARQDKPVLALGNHNPLLHAAKLDVQYFSQIILSQRLEDQHFIYPIHEFR